jgi:transporter family protein
VAISVFLVLSDYVYLVALSYPESLIAVVSTIRRAGTIIPFLYRLIFLHEKDPWKKLLCLTGILTGLVFLLIGSL